MREIRKLIRVFGLIILLTGCSYQSFRYSATDPVRLDPVDHGELGPVFYGIGTGPMWSKCSTVNQEAVDNLLNQAKAAEYDAVTDLQWYDYKSAQWVKEPACLTEFGWITGMLYTFWAQKATMVRVKANGIKKASLTNPDNFFRAKTVGSNELTSEEVRQVDPRKFAIAPVFGPSLIVEIGLKFARFVDPNTRWAANLNFARILGDMSGHAGCGIRPSADGWEIFAVRREQFLGNSFYFGLGPAVQDQVWFWSGCDISTSSPNTSTQTTASKSRYWHYGLVGLDAGIGNEWRSSSGLFGGCEWFGGFVGMKVWQHGDEVTHGGNKPYRFTPRLLACHLGFEI